jgi:hypothetical protein
LAPICWRKASICWRKAPCWASALLAGGDLVLDRSDPSGVDLLEGRSGWRWWRHELLEVGDGERLEVVGRQAAGGGGGMG